MAKDMYQKRKERQEKKNTSNVPENVFSSSNINWYPGHMAKAKREMMEVINKVDMVIELRDARIPYSSTNPVIDEIAINKPRLIVISKKDKANEEVTKKWIEYFKQQGHLAIALNLVDNYDITTIISKACESVMAEKIAKLKARGMKRVEIKAMVVGIPNVGKSTLINAVSKKKVAKTANKPGVTKSLQWIKTGSSVALLDTPGVLWPRFEDKKVGYLLAITGAIKDEILPIHDVISYAIDYLSKNYANRLIERYSITIDEHILQQIALNRGCILVDKTIDEARLYQLILKDIRDNQLGPISWEQPDEN